MPTKPKFVLGLVATSAFMGVVASAIVWLPSAFAENIDAVKGPIMEGEIWSWGLLAAALATGLSSLGAGIAVGHVGVAAVGAIAEKPELFGRVLILVGLAEGIAIYGLIMSILILNLLV